MLHHNKSKQLRRGTELKILFFSQEVIIIDPVGD